MKDWPSVEGFCEGRVAVDACGSCAATASYLFWIQDFSSLFIHFLPLPLLFLKPGLWLPPFGTLPALHVELTWLYEPTLNVDPDLLLALLCWWPWRFFRSSVDFFFFIDFCSWQKYAVVLSSSFHRNMVTENSRQLEESGWQCKLSFSWVHSSAKYGNGLFFLFYFFFFLFSFFSPTFEVSLRNWSMSEPESKVVSGNSYTGHRGLERQELWSRALQFLRCALE